MRNRRVNWRRLWNRRRKSPRHLFAETSSGLPSRLGDSRSGDLFADRDRVRELSRVQSGEPRSYLIVALRVERMPEIVPLGRHLLAHLPASTIPLRYLGGAESRLSTASRTPRLRWRGGSVVRTCRLAG